MNSLKEFLKEIDKIKKQLNNRYHCDFPLYRGSAKASWSLEPYLLRKTKRYDDNNLFIKEASLFQDFISQAGDHLKTYNTWETLFVMRHHGMPTRLLDWTENLFVALYFAILDTPKAVKNPCIWVLDPYRLNKKSKEITQGYVINPELESEEYFELFCKSFPYKKAESIPSYPIVIYPFRQNERIIAQQGLFTIHGINRTGIEKQCPEVLKQIIIPARIISEVKNILELAGLNRYTIYRDLDSLSSILGKFPNI